MGSERANSALIDDVPVFGWMLIDEDEAPTGDIHVVIDDVRSIESGQSLVKKRSLVIRTEVRGLSSVDRSVDRQTDYCKQCAANTDPANVPVHPGCNCDVRTDAVQIGVADPEHPFVKGPVLRSESTVFEDLLEIALPDGVQLDSSSIAILDPEDARYGDILRWLEQIQSTLETADYVVIAIDTAEQTQELIEEIGTAAELSSDVLDKRLWLAIGKGVFL